MLKSLIILLLEREEKDINNQYIKGILGSTRYVDLLTVSTKWTSYIDYHFAARRRMLHVGL